MNYLFYNPSARNGKAAEDLEMIKKTLDGQKVEEYAVTDIDDYVSVIDGIEPDDIVYIVGGDGTLNRFINDSRTCVFWETYFSTRREPATISNMMSTLRTSYTESD